ncbi:hypothetical protein UPYG_G00238400 [Umbra pygmaea]|uniref:Homeobox domain-containing protein n=1 Tax=Umbra pygmaea TaxID=75934 RepID=A0ABD0WJM4_UMBPY
MRRGKIKMEKKVDPATAKGKNKSSDLTPALPPGSATALPTAPCPNSTQEPSFSITSDTVEANKRDIGAVSPSSPPSPHFGLKQNHVVCLPLVSEHQKLLWTCSEPIQQLDDVAYLKEAFNIFPYPTLRETVALAKTCSLHLDQVRVWFMVQRLRFGISWEPEEIGKARRKMCRPNQIQVDKEGMFSEMAPLLSHKGDGKIRNTHSHFELWQSFLQNSKPSCNEVKRLQAITKFKMKYIRKWFCNRRISVSLSHSVNDKQELDDGQSQSNSCPTQPSTLRSNRGVRTPRTKKGGSQAEGVISNSIRDTDHQNRSSLEQRKEEKGLMSQHEKNREKGSKWKSTKLKRLKENGDNVTKHNMKEEQAKKQQEEQGIAKFQNKHKMGKTMIKTQEQQKILKKFFLTCPWPTGKDRLLLQDTTGLSCQTIARWFGDTRYNVKQGWKRWITKEDRLKVLAKIRKKPKKKH